MFALLLAGLSVACTLSELDEFVLYGSPEDVTPPADPVVEEVVVHRGAPGRFDPRPHWGMPPCELGEIGLYVVPDDEDDVGYLFELVEGTLPELWQSDVPTLGEYPFLVWTDGADRHQEPIDVVVAVTAIDRTGNLSLPVEIEVSDPGSPKGCGCSTASGSTTLWWGLLPLVARRRVRPVSS